jgi:hypothetical protein
MVRVLVLIAVTGFFVSLVTLSVAVAVGGPAMFEDAMWRGGWGPHWSHHGDWNGVGWDDRWDRRHGGGDAQTTRDLTWTGGDSLEVDVPADVQYTQGPVAKVTVSGLQRDVDDLEIDGGHLAWRDGRHHHLHFGDLQVVMTAPSVTRFEINGSGKLAIANYKQDKLDLRISGNGDASATGETGAVGLNVSGSGDADLGGLKAKSAEVDISGSGQAKLAPSDSAKVDISGSGDVTLLTHPPQLSTHISGSGSLNQEAPAAQAQPPAQPAAPAPPKKKGKGA